MVAHTQKDLSVSVSETEAEEACWPGKPGLGAFHHQDSSAGVKETVWVWNWSSCHLFLARGTHYSAQEPLAGDTVPLEWINSILKTTYTASFYIWQILLA